MAATQLVVHVDDRSLSAVDNARHLDPTSFDHPDEGLTVPRFGSLSLLRLAAFAVEGGYELVGLTLRDISMRPLPEWLDEDVTSSVAEALRSNNVDGARKLLNGERGPYTVVAIALVDDHDDDIRVARLGEVETNSAAVINDLVIPAWSSLQLT